MSRLGKKKGIKPRLKLIRQKRKRKKRQKILPDVPSSHSEEDFIEEAMEEEEK